MEKKSTQTTAEERQIETVEKSSKKKGIIAIAFILVLLIIVGVLVAIIIGLLGKDDEQTAGGGTASAKKRNTVVTMENKDEIQADLNNKVAEGLFEVKMNVDWTFKDAAEPSENAYVANVPTNTTTVYFDVTLDGTGETIYESPYLPVGTELQNLTLDKDLPAGTYAGTVMYHLVDENYNDTGRMAIAVTIKVQN